jgi:hypothetical protein
MSILRVFADRGAPSRRIRDWTGRWWTLWGAMDLVPLGERVVVANPNFIDPFTAATEIEVTGRDVGRISLASGYASHGEAVRRTRNKAGTVTDVWLAGAELKPEKNVAAEMERRYAARRRR